MKRWWLWIALMLSLGVNVGVLFMIAAHRRAPQQLEQARRIEAGQRSEAGRPNGVGRPRQAPPLDALADRLRLRGEARDSFLEAQGRFFAEVTNRRVELATLRQELRRELTSPSPDRRRIDRILERTGKATAALDGAFVDNVLAVRRILGPRQQRAYFRFLNRLRAGQR